MCRKRSLNTRGMILLVGAALASVARAGGPSADQGLSLMGTPDVSWRMSPTPEGLSDPDWRLLTHPEGFLHWAWAHAASSAGADRQPVAGDKGEQPPPIPSNKERSIFAGWNGSAEFGLTGSTGNSETLNVRAGITGARKTQETDTALGLMYLYSNNEGAKTKNRAELDARNDWNLGESPWSLFAQGRVEYDEFQDWRWRISTYAGPGYSFIRDEKTTLKGRLGVGLSKEFLGSRNELIPEALAGLDFTHQLTERQRIFYNGEYLPSLSEFPQYRLSQKAGWEILVDPEVKMTLRLGVEHRYQSNPGDGFRHSDLDYYAILAWAF